MSAQVENNVGFARLCREMRAALRQAERCGLRIGWPPPPPEEAPVQGQCIAGRVLSMRGDFRAAEVPGLTAKQAENALQRLRRKGRVVRVTNGRGHDVGGLWRVNDQAEARRTERTDNANT